MLGFKLSSNMARLGTLCVAFALLALVVGCPFVTPNPCATADCDDNNACTDDTCTVVEGAATCGHTNNTATCDDGDACTDGDVCGGGTCAGTAIAGCCATAADCDDGNECTDDTCDNATCSNTNNTAACDDGNECTDDVCSGGACVGTNNTAACDDGDACTDGDVCAGGACAGTAIAGCCTTDADCDTAAGEVCTVDNVCEVPAPACTTDADCDDSDNCTDDACTAGACENTAKDCGDQICRPADGSCVDCVADGDCNDGFSCTVDYCDAGACVNDPKDTRCDDFLYCTGTETCDTTNADADAAGCVASGDPCEGIGKICKESTDSCEDCVNNAECDDGVPCTDDACNLGTCQHNNVDANCPDPLNCDGVDYCDPADADADANGCVQPGNPCDPLLCNEATYDPADNPGSCTLCQSNTDCTDGITCTKDSCNGATGACSHTDDSTLCPDALFCDGVDICAPGHPNADADGCIPDPYACPNACNEATDECFNCTSNAECDDGLDCTDDTCNGGTGDCSHVDNCTSGACNFLTGDCE